MGAARESVQSGGKAERQKSTRLESLLGQLSEYRREAVQKKLADIPVKLRSQYVRIMQGRYPKMAIYVYCLECTGWSRQEVRQCTVEGCPLHPYRPFRND